MALQISTVTKHGFIAESAYLRVEGVKLIGKSNIEFQLRSYKNKESSLAYDDNNFSCEYNMQGNNPIAQAYSHLKTLPDFAGATDC